MEADCKQEIESIHDWFQAWFRGEDAQADRLARSLAPEFLMVSPVGKKLNKQQLLALLAAGKATRPASFSIEIRNYTAIRIDKEAALVSYEEWQQSDDQPAKGRISTALFLADKNAPFRVAWRFLQETWLASPTD